MLLGSQFQITLQQDQKFRILWSELCSSNVSMCIYLVFVCFFWCYLAVVRVDLAFFANDYLATRLVAASYCDC